MKIDTGYKKTEPLSVSGKNSDKMRNGTSVKHENNIEIKMTGMTAFFSNETFLKTSYEPNRIAETKAKNKAK